MENKVRILHVVKDDKKFFNSVISCFESDNRLQNECILIVKNEKFAFQSIEPTPKIKVLSTRKQVKSKIKSDDYDIIFFILCLMNYGFCLIIYLKPRLLFGGLGVMNFMNLLEA